MFLPRLTISITKLLPYVLTTLRPYGKARANMVAAGVLPAVRATLTSRRLATDVEVVAAMCGLCQVLLRLGLGLAPSSLTPLAPTPRPHPSTLTPSHPPLALAPSPTRPRPWPRPLALLQPPLTITINSPLTTQPPPSLSAPNPTPRVRPLPTRCSSAGARSPARAARCARRSPPLAPWRRRCTRCVATPRTSAWR